MNEQINDQKVAGWLMHYFHQDISINELKKLNQWLQESPENKETFFQLKNIHDSLSHQTLLSEEDEEQSWQKVMKLMTGI